MVIGGNSGRGVVVVGLLTLTALTSAHARSVERLAQHLDAYVEFDNTAGEWTIGNDLVRYTLHVRRDRGVDLVGLAISGTSDPVTLDGAPDALVTLGGDTVRLGEPGSGFLVEGVDPAAGTHFVALTIRFVSATTPVAVSRHYVVYPGTAAVEMWTAFDATDMAMSSVENINAYRLIVPSGQIDWVSGLDTPESDGGAFTRRSRTLNPGERLALGSPTLSSESDMPYFSVGNGHRRVFGGMLWSGGWSASLDRQDDVLDVTLGLPPMSAWAGPGRSVEGPHAFVGVVWDVPGADVAAVTQFVRAGRANRPVPALTTFNTWFVHGIDVDERKLMRDIDGAAEIGIEQVQLDAGWYRHENPTSVYDFSNGLGSWEADSDRFPSGLGALADYAHVRGLRFGLWVEPERVALDTVGRDGLAEESFLAQQDGAYKPGTPNDEATDAQICLANPAARAWVLERLTRLIEDVRPDNLKWDVNRWVQCTRPGHGHPVNGGNFAHTQALYEILAALRERFPALTIENCSGGGHRLDFALARLTDSAWMDDRSSPSAHVRRNLQGLLALFPADYLFSYVMSHPDEPLRGANDMALLVRSRMPGTVGLATDLDELSEQEKNELHQQFSLVRSLRDLQSAAVTYTLTTQRPGPGEWEVVQQVIPGSGTSLIFAYAYGVADPIVVSLRGIQPELTYELRSSDRGTIGRMSGADLIARGFEIAPAPESAAQVLVLEPLGPVQRAKVTTVRGAGR